MTHFQFRRIMIETKTLKNVDLRYKFELTDYVITIFLERIMIMLLMACSNEMFLQIRFPEHF